MNENIIRGAAYHIIDLKESYGHLFNESTLSLLNKEKATTKENVLYFVGTAEGEHNIPKVVNELVNAVNFHSEKGHITHFLQPLKMIHLVNFLPPDYAIKPSDSWAIYIFPVFTSEGEKIAKEANYAFYAPDGVCNNFIIKDKLS